MHKLAALFTIQLLVGCLGPKNTKDYIFNNPPLSEGDKICFIGDSGKGTKEQYKIAEILKDQNCTQVRHLGDIIYPDGLMNDMDQQFFPKFYGPYWPILSSTPFHLSLGNHDYRGSPSAWKKLANKHENIIFPHYYYIQTYGSVCFLHLDTNSLFAQQTYWLDRLENKIKAQCKLTLAMGHHPYQASGKHGNAKLFVKKFLEDSVIGRVDAYIAGHEHHLEDVGLHKGTHLLISGAVAEYRKLTSKPKLWAKSTHGFLVLTYKELQGRPSFTYNFIGVDLPTEAISSEHGGLIQGVGLR